MFYSEALSQKSIHGLYCHLALQKAKDAGGRIVKNLNIKGTKRAISVMLSLFLVLTMFAGVTFATDDLGETDPPEAACTHDCSDGTCAPNEDGTCDHECEFCAVPPEEDPEVTEPEGESEEGLTNPSDSLEEILSQETVEDDQIDLIQPFNDIAEANSIMPFAAGFSSDLTDFLTDVVIIDTSTGNPIGPTDTVYTGQTYKFEFTFKETSQLQMAYDTTYTPPSLTYQLPTDLNIQNPIDVTPLYSPTTAGAIIGWYKISTSGLVQMWFDNVMLNGQPTPPGINFIDYYANVTITLDVFAQLVGGGDGSIDFGNGVQVVIPVPQTPPPSLTMNKSSRYDPNTEKIYYMVTITALGAPGDSITDIMWTDTPTIVPGVSFLNTPNDAFSGFRYFYGMVGGSFTGMEPPFDTVVWNPTPPPLQFTFENFVNYGTSDPLVLNTGNFITILYTLDLQTLLNNNNYPGGPLANMNDLEYDFIVNNNAMVEGSSGDPATDDTTDHVKKVFEISKEGIFIAGDGTTTNPNRIQWTVTIGDGISTPLNTGLITDTLGAGMAFPGASAIEITLYGSSGDTPISTDLSDTNLQPSSLASNIFTFTVPSAASAFLSTLTNGTVYQVLIVYSTVINPPITGEPSVTYKNDVKIEFPDGPGFGAGGNVPIITSSVDVAKTTSGICGNPNLPAGEQGPLGEKYWVDYTITIQMPPGLQGQPLFLYDTLGSGANAQGPTPNVPVDLSMQVTGAETGGIPVVYTNHTDPIPYGANDWRLFLGTTGSTVPATGSWGWDYSYAIELTVSYRIYLSDTIVNTLASNTNYYLSNVIYLINSADPALISGNSVGAKNVNDYWPIIKSAKATENPALFNYTVILKGGFSSRTAPLLQTGSNPVYTDTFDNRLVYVPGSFYIVDTSLRRYYVPTSDVSLSYNVDALSNDSFSINLNPSVTGWRVYSGTTPPGALIGTAPANWFSGRYNYEVHYQLKLKSAYLDADQSGLANTAGILVNTNECLFQNNASVGYVYAPLTKTMTPLSTGSARVNVEIIINPDGEIVFSDPPNPGPAVITAKDLLTNVTLFMDSVEIYTQTKTGGIWNGIWKQVTPISFNDRQLWSVNAVPSAQVPSGYSGQVDFVIPNQTPVMITYQVLVTIPEGSSDTISNEIWIFGESGSDEQSGYQVGGSDAGVGADLLNLRVFKRDNVGNNLHGAKFMLYVTDISAGFIPPQRLPYGCRI